MISPMCRRLSRGTRKPSKILRRSRRGSRYSSVSMRENLRRVDRHAAHRLRSLYAGFRLLGCALLLSLLRGGARAVAEEDQLRPRKAVVLEGGLAVPVGEYGDGYVGWDIPVRLGFGLQLVRHFWVEPFVSLGLIRPIQVDDFKSLSGFRLLAGVALQLHSALEPTEVVDFYGGVDVSFERVVAHGLVEGCNGCLPSDTVTLANGLMAGLRLGALFRASPDVRIGPYVGAQLSWLPGLSPLLTTHPLNGPSVTTPVDLGHLHYWFEGGIRAAISLD